MIQSANFSFPFTIFLCSPRKFRWNPAVFLETAGFFHSATPSGCFSLCLERPRKSPKLPALRADVFAKVRARHLGFLLLSRRGVQNPSILTIFSDSRIYRKQLFPLPFLPIRAFFANAPARRRNIRFLGFRWIRARLCPENRTQPRHAAHAGGQAFFCCVCWNASNRFRMRSCSHSASNFASFCS